MKSIILILGIALTLTCSSFCQAAGSLAIYDDFQSRQLDPARWFGIEWTSGSALESSRNISKGSLHLMSRSCGNMDSNEGTSQSGNQLLFTNPNAITTIKATVVIKDMNLETCIDNVSATRSRTRISGYFFNTSNPIENSHVNDVFAMLAIQGTSGAADPGQLSVIFSSSICSDQDCSSGTTLAYAQVGTVQMNKKVNLKLEWDKKKHQFVVQVNKEPQVFFPYEISDLSLPGSDNKRIEINNYVANCTSDPRPTALTDVFFDNVYVNRSAVVSP